MIGSDHVAKAAKSGRWRMQGKMTLLARSIGRGISDDNWEAIDLAHIDIWKHIARDLAINEISDDIGNWTISFDFSAALHWMNDHYERYVRFFKKGDKEVFASADRDNIAIIISISLNEYAHNPRIDFGSNYVEYILAETFLIANISAPGSCNLYGAYLVNDPPRKSITGGEIRTDLDMSNHSFEAAIYEKNRFPWLEIDILQYELVATWVRRVMSRFRMLPVTPTGRCLFALLHIAKQDDYGPATLIWIFYALESFYQCKVGENLSTLNRRIGQVLELDAEGIVQLNKMMRKLYDIRSSFVHGGLTVIHPLRNEILDRSVDIELDKLLSVIDFGVAVLLKSLQIAIFRNTPLPEFVEVTRWPS